MRESGIEESVVLKGAVENASEAFITIDQDHTVVFFNRAAETMFGYGREEVVGRDLNDILSPACSKDHRGAVKRYVETRKPRLIGHETEVTAVRKNGDAFPAAICFSVSEVEGRLFFTALMRDLSETRALQERIIRSERLAALGQVVAEIVHELKNPLVLIGGLARRIRKMVAGETERSQLEMIAAEVTRLEDLLEDLREVYVPKSLALEVLDINELLRDIHQLTREACRKKDIRVTLEGVENIALVQGDRTKLKQVILNLVKNAIEAVGEGGSLSIGSRPEGELVEVSIEDNGPGIGKDQIGKIFDPFFTTKQHGTGLGLSICKRIIGEHDRCELSVESEEGRGTIARISFPLHPCG